MNKRKLNESDDQESKKVCIQKEDIFDASFFEESSKAWRSNKIEQENCTYVYKCTFVNKKGVRCNRPLYEYELREKKRELKENAHLFCKCHIHKKYNPNLHLWN